MSKFHYAVATNSQLDDITISVQVGWRFVSNLCKVAWNMVSCRYMCTPLNPLWFDVLTVRRFQINPKLVIWWLNDNLNMYCQPWLLSGRNVRWPRRMLPRWVTVSMPTGQTDRRTDGLAPDRYITLTARRGHRDNKTRLLSLLQFSKWVDTLLMLWTYKPEVRRFVGQ